MFQKEDFMQWLGEFYEKKTNELQFSRALPNRIQKITLDLSTAPTQPVLIDIPFKTMVVNRIYSTATPTTDKAGSLKIMLDINHIANQLNAYQLFVNDTLKAQQSARNCYATWTAQADTSVDLYFFPDIEVILGTTKTQIVGTVTTTPLAAKFCAPSSVSQVSVTAAGAPVTTTVGAGKVHQVRVFMQAFNASGDVVLKIGSNKLMEVSGIAGQTAVQTFVFPAGTAYILDVVANAGFGFISIEEYTL